MQDPAVDSLTAWCCWIRPHARHLSPGSFVLHVLSDKLRPFGRPNWATPHDGGTVQPLKQFNRMQRRLSHMNARYCGSVTGNFPSHMHATPPLLQAVGVWVPDYLAPAATHRHLVQRFRSRRCHRVQRHRHVVRRVPQAVGPNVPRVAAPRNPSLLFQTTRVRARDAMLLQSADRDVVRPGMAREAPDTWQLGVRTVLSDELSPFVFVPKVPRGQLHATWPLVQPQTLDSRQRRRRA